MKQAVSQLLTMLGREFKFFVTKFSVPSQTHLVHSSSWDHLIILDACRYDVFKQEVSDYLDGNLMKVLSPGSETSEWLKSVWENFYDLTYFSANPVVNSKIAIQGFKARSHFKEIIDIWDWGWSEELGTVPPWNVNETVIESQREKSVIHFIQPHGPWIGQTKLAIQAGGEGIQDPRKPKQLELLDKASILFSERIKKGEISIEVLRRAYRDNLRLVLKHVAELLPHLRGRVVLTSDHGEFLGEYGLFLHPSKVKAVELRSVPWFRIR